MRIGFWAWLDVADPTAKAIEMPSNIEGLLMVLNEGLPLDRLMFTRHDMVRQHGPSGSSRQKEHGCAQERVTNEYRFRD